MKHSLKDHIEYLIMLSFQTAIRVLPLRAMAAAADIIAMTAGALLKPRNRIVMRNLDTAFPDMSRKRKNEIRNSSYRNILISSFESYKYMYLSRKEILKHLKVGKDSADLLSEINDLGRGCVVVGGHYGFFEAGGHYANCFGYKTAYVVANQKNKLTERLIDLPREKAGIMVIHRKQMTKLFRALKDNYFVALLSDQNAGTKHGIFVDFFGVKASTHKNPAVISLKYDIPMLLVNTVRCEKDRTSHDLSFKRIVFDDILSKETDFDSKVEMLVQRYTGELEDQIRKAPEHYWWIHKRYKTRPDRSEKFYK